MPQPSAITIHKSRGKTLDEIARRPVEMTPWLKAQLDAMPGVIIRLPFHPGHILTDEN